MNDAHIRDRMERAEASNSTLKEANERLQAEVREMRETFGIQTLMGGNLRIDFQKLVDMLGLEQAMELRAVIDETYRVTGAAGEKPKVRVKAA